MEIMKLTLCVWRRGTTSKRIIFEVKKIGLLVLKGGPSDRQRQIARLEVESAAEHYHSFTNLFEELVTAMSALSSVQLR